MTSNYARRGGPLALLAVLAAACGEPAVGGQVQPPPAPEGYRLAIASARIDATSHVVVTFTVTNEAAPVTLADLPALRPSFTLAGLLTDPVSGLPAWQSYLLTGTGTLANLPLGGPGTPPALVLQNQKQPGAVTGAASNLADLGGGRFAITITPPLPAGFDPSRTMRVGGWLNGVTVGTAATSATFDWVPAGGTPAERLTVLDKNCDVCHGLLFGHARRTGVKLCLTCHTIQNADPDTQDPAALVRALTVTPEARTAVAGAGATSFTATLRSSTAAVTWSLSPASGAGSLSAATVTATSTGGATSTVRWTPPAPDAAATGPIAATLTAAVTIQGAAAGGYTPPPVTLSFPVVLSVVQPPAGPAVAVSPAAQTVLENGAAVPLAAALVGVTGPVSWSLSPAGAGTLSAATGAAVTYTPPGAVAGPTAVTVTATAGGVSGAATITVLQGSAGSATRYSDPNPLDLGRMAHRIHRGKTLPTLYLAASIAPAPLLPPAGPAPAALPLPYAVGRNAVAPGTEYAIWGFRSLEFVAGRVVARADNFQPARVMAEGITFPRDIRDCDACHKGAPQAAEVVTAISRRTCQGCHPDVWYGTGPITDLVHLAHPGGPQADDTRCAGCHVSGPGLRVPIGDAHLPPLLHPRYDQPKVEVTGVSDFQAGRKPTFTLRVTDRQGPLTSLGAPAPAFEQGLTPSPVPRALARLSLTVSGPTRDYLTGNAPLSLTVPLTLTADPVTGDFTFTSPSALPAAATGTWGIGAEARRAGTVPLYDPLADAFPWPYTGEAITEFADNPVVYVDTAFGSWPGGAPEKRRSRIERNNCRACHLELSLHGGLRHNPEYCVLCHTPDTTDWNRRSKGPDGNVNLATVYSDGQFGAYDGLEERSIHLKVMVHRIHTGAGQGRAHLEVAAPHVIYGFGGVPFFFDEAVFPNRLADCTLCHDGTTWLLEAIPADASPTIANESRTVVHAASAAHTASDPRWLPIAATCNSCHGTADAFAHAAKYTVDGQEQCAQCHAKGTMGVPAAHGLATPTATAGTTTSP